MRTAWPLALIAAVVTACGGAEPSGTPSTAASPSAAAPLAPTPTPSPEVTASASPGSADAPGVLRRVTDDAVVPPAEGERYTNPGVVLEVDGTLHLLRNSFSRWPGDSTVHHLTSTDGGATWHLADPDPVLTSDDVPYADQIAFVTSAVIEDDGTWTAYLYTYDGETTRAVVGRATAPGPGGPWTVDPEPVLEPGEDGAWDDVRLAEPSVLRGGDGYLMWYAGFGAGRVSSIGLARSADGIAWTKQDGPVLTGEEAWTRGSIAGPQVLPTDEGYVMTYMSSVPRTFVIGVATSPDGVSWTPLAGNPVLDRQDTGRAFFQSEIFPAGDRTRFLLEIGTGNERTNLFLYDVALDGSG